MSVDLFHVHRHIANAVRQLATLREHVSPGVAGAQWRDAWIVPNPAFYGVAEKRTALSDPRGGGDGAWNSQLGGL